MADHGPNRIEEAMNLAKAVVKHLKDGRRQASPGVQIARKAICDPCIHRNPTKDICNICGCRLPLKRSWASEACPTYPPLWESEP